MLIDILKNIFDSITLKQFKCSQHTATITSLNKQLAEAVLKINIIEKEIVDATILSKKIKEEIDKWEN